MSSIPLTCKLCEMKDMFDIDCLESEDIIEHCPHRKAIEELKYLEAKFKNKQIINAIKINKAKYKKRHSNYII